MTEPKPLPYKNDFVWFKVEEDACGADDMPPPYEDIEAGVPTKPRNNHCVYWYIILWLTNFVIAVVLCYCFWPYPQAAGVNVRIQCDVHYAGISEKPKPLICYIYHEQDSKEGLIWHDRLEGSITPSDPNYIMSLLSDQYLQEELNVDLNGELSMAKLEVSDFRGARSSKFVHDYKARMSAIIDGAGNWCFITPLDESLLMPPEELLDLMPTFGNMGSEVGMRNMSARLMPLKDLNKLPDGIAYECRDGNAYMLHVDGLHPMERAVQQAPQLTKFVDFLGRGLVTYNLLNVADFKKIENVLNYQAYAKDSTAP